MAESSIAQGARVNTTGQGTLHEGEGTVNWTSSLFKKGNNVCIIKSS